MEVTKELLEAGLKKVQAVQNGQAADFNAAKKLGQVEGQASLLQNLLQYMAQPEPVEAKTEPAPNPVLKVADTGTDPGQGQ